MHEIVKINLDNEMDLILAHKRSMKIAELCGLPSSAQTRFATAVSEIARCSIANGRDSILTIGIQSDKPSAKFIRIVLNDSIDLKKCSPEAYAYAARLSENIDYEYTTAGSVTSLVQLIPNPGLISETKIKSFKDYFKYEPPLSPYDEIRKKNLELISLSEKLTLSESRYRQLTESLPVAIALLDNQMRITFGNESLRRAIPKPIEAFDRANLTGLIHPDDLERLLGSFDQIRPDQQAFSGQVRFLIKGEELWHLFSVVPNRVGETVKSWLVYFVDIHAQKVVAETLRDNTELKNIQRRLEAMNQELSFKNNELEQFAFVASHDLQEPLRKIRMMVSRAVTGLDESQREELYLDRINGAAERMSRLIDDVLNYSRIGALPKEFRPVDLNRIIDDTRDDLDFAIEDAGATFEIGDLPAITGNEMQLHQLFYNIISNSLKFNRGNPHIRISARTEDISINRDDINLHGTFHIVSVKDNGIGIDRQFAKRIFNMFQRLHHREDYAGNGIGLALCKKIIVDHGGAIELESTPGEGTTFHLYFPA